jgi:hypothetical protein
MKLNFKDILNAVNQIEQKRGYYGEHFDIINLYEQRSEIFRVADPTSAPDSVIRIYSVEREYDGTFTVHIPDSHLEGGG